MEKRLCKNFCPYYKPSKDKGLACKGFSVIEKLLKGGKNISFQKSEKIPGREIKEMLVQTMCITCPFYENDCDFIQQRKNAPPCGGFLLLGQLLESDSITIDDIIKNISC